MLNSNKVRFTLFKKEQLYKLSTKRLKAFKKTCEARVRGFSIKFNEEYTVSIQSHPDYFNNDTIEKYKIWSANMSLIRTVLKERLNPSEPYYPASNY